MPRETSVTAQDTLKHVATQDTIPRNMKYALYICLFELLVRHALSVSPSFRYRREITRRKLEQDAAKIELLRSEKERIQATRGQLSSET